MKWLPVPGYEKHYEVSDEGLVRTVDGRIVKQWLNDQGYSLIRVSGPRAVLRVHRVVAEAFIGNPGSLPFVNHIDCVRHNNAALNLEWCTQRENLDHSTKLGRMQRNYWTGRRSPNASLSDDEAKMIRDEYARGGTSHMALSIKYGTNKRTVGRILAGRYYAPNAPLPEPPKEGA